MFLSFMLCCLSQLFHHILHTNTLGYNLRLLDKLTLFHNLLVCLYGIRTGVFSTATEKGSLSKHKQSEHEGKKYPCNACNFFAAKKVILRTHKQSVHDRKKYHCDACDFLTTQKGSLIRHT